MTSPSVPTAWTYVRNWEGRKHSKGLVYQLFDSLSEFQWCQNDCRNLFCYWFCILYSYFFFLFVSLDFNFFFFIVILFNASLPHSWWEVKDGGQGPCLGQNIRAQVAYLLALGMVLAVIIRGVKNPGGRGNRELAEVLTGQLPGATEIAWAVCFILTKMSSFPYSVLWLPSTNHVLKLVGTLLEPMLSVLVLPPFWSVVLNSCWTW